MTMTNLIKKQNTYTHTHTHIHASIEIKGRRLHITTHYTRSCCTLYYKYYARIKKTRKKMDQKHCAEIIKSIPQIMKLFNYEHFRDQCLKQNLVFDAMLENLETINITNEARFEALLRKLTHRGPNAYKKFREILLIACDELFNLTHHHLTNEINSLKHAHTHTHKHKVKVEAK